MMSAKSAFCMTIELKSDMCCGSGEANGVSVDQLATLDRRGLPIIPGKRLKGLLREEAALIELPDQRGMTEALFGTSGAEESGMLAFGDARLVGHESIERLIDEKGLTPAAVSAVCTTTRTTTAVEEDGVAQDHTLRTIQLVRRCDTSGTPTCFECSVRGTELTEAQKDFLGDVVHCLRAIGIQKSRGLGEVTCSGAWIDKQPAENDYTGLTKDALVQDDASDRVCMGYRISLKEPAVIQGGAGQCLDYIPGSVVQGIFASLFRNDKDMLHGHVLKGTRYSNAYVDCTGSTTAISSPVPFTYQGEKNDMGELCAETNQRTYRLYDAAMPQAQDDEASVQKVGISGYGTLADGTYLKTEVGQSLSFHSSSPNSPQGKQFYSLQSINAHQSFSGTIETTGVAAKKFAEALEARGGHLRVGAAKSAGFGTCEMGLYEVAECTVLKLNEGDRVAIHLVSDVIFVDENGTNSVDAVSFARALSDSGLLGFKFNASMDAAQSRESCRVFAKTCVVGGYNAHWRLPKQQYMAFQKGSVLVATVTSCTSETIPSGAWTGLLQQEGYGQLFVQKLTGIEVPRAYVKVSPTLVGNTTSEGQTQAKDATESFEHDLNLNDAKERAALLACKLGDAYPLGASSKSSFMRIASVFGSAQKTANAGTLRETFVELATSNLSDEAELKGQCDKIAREGNSLLARYPQMSDTGKDAVFAQIVRGYLRQVKVRYSTQQGGSNE